MTAIRPAGVEAVPLLVELHAAAFHPDERWGPVALTTMLGMEGAFGLLAEEEGEPLGFALGRVAADEAEVLTIAVRPEVRRRGHARALLRALMATAAARGARALFLEVSEPNDAARALYAALGAEQVGRRPRYYHDGSAALVLRLALAPIPPS